jgi:hypothetical protein
MKIRQVWIRLSSEKRRHVLWLHGCILSIGLILSSCGGSEVKSNTLDSPETLAAALEQAGAEVEFGEERGPSVVELPPRSMRVNGEQLWIYHSLEPLESSRVRTAFMSEQFIWSNEHLIVRYDSNDGGTILLMDGLLGEALIRPSAAGDEPYPPAVPAAIRMVAEELGGQPAEIEVLAYKMEEWGDTCLELGASGDTCTEQTTPGWRIDLRYENHEIEVHTDLLGDIVRWRSP